MKLYEISQSYLYLLELLQNEETDEQMILDTLESLEGELEEKADNYAKIIKTLELEASAIKQEEDRLKARRTKFENNATMLKNNLEEAMKLTGKTKFKTLLFNFYISKNGGLAPLKIDVPVSKIPDEYFKERTEKDLNNKYIRDCLDNGKINFAHYEEKGESLKIK